MYNWCLQKQFLLVTIEGNCTLHNNYWQEFLISLSLFLSQFPHCQWAEGLCKS